MNTSSPFYCCRTDNMAKRVRITNNSLRRIDYFRLGTLRSKIPPEHPPFDIERFRSQGYDLALRG